MANQDQKQQSKFQQACQLNVNDKTEKKKNLTYLSWSWAWQEFKKIYPEATYKIKKFEGKPYIFDKDLGYMVFTKVIADNQEHEMWLPVMDGANKAMINYSYEYQDKYGNKKTVAPASMFDINKTIMRCLTKNLAMFGLGLYIYSGEDLPEKPEEEKQEEKDKIIEQIKQINDLDELRKAYQKNKGQGKEVEEAIIKRGEELKQEQEATQTQKTSQQNQSQNQSQGGDEPLVNLDN